MEIRKSELLRMIASRVQFFFCPWRGRTPQYLTCRPRALAQSAMMIWWKNIKTNNYMGFTVHFWTSQWKQFLTTMLLSCDHQRPTLCSNTMSTISWENVSLYFTWKTGSVHPILSPLYFDLSFVFSFMLVRSIPLFLLLCTSRVFICLSLYSLSVCSFSGVSTIPSVPCAVL